MNTIDRRGLLALLAALPASRALAQESGPVRLGTLTPQTGAGGPYGPVMVKAARAVTDEVNAAGGVLGRPVELFSEDDETSPEAGVRAARKLIDVDKVCAVIGTWASSVTTAVAPLCWESKTFLTTVSGADSITLLPHQGYLVRTQPNTLLQGRKFGEFALELGAKRIFMLSPQTPFTQSQFNAITEAVKPAGAETGILVYDDKKPSYRSEVDEALRFKPDLIVLGGYTPDTAVLLKDLYRADFGGLKLAFGYAVNQKLVDSVPPDVSDKIYTLSPSSALESGAYGRLVKLIGVAAPDPYTCQVYDQVNLVLMAIAFAGEASGTAIKDSIRPATKAAGGVKVDNAVDGIKAIAAKQPVDYDGASGPCAFTPIGDITDSKFRYEQVRDGKITLVKIA